MAKLFCSVDYIRRSILRSYGKVFENLPFNQILFTFSGFLNITESSDALKVFHPSRTLAKYITFINAIPKESGSPNTLGRISYLEN